MNFRLIASSPFIHSGRSPPEDRSDKCYTVPARTVQSRRESDSSGIGSVRRRPESESSGVSVVRSRSHPESKSTGVGQSRIRLEMMVETLIIESPIYDTDSRRLRTIADDSDTLRLRLRTTATPVGRLRATLTKSELVVPPGFRARIGLIITGKGSEW